MSFIFKKNKDLIETPYYSSWIIFTRLLINNNNYPRVITYINIKLIKLYFLLRKDIIIINASRIQHRLGSRVMMTWLATLLESQSVPHVVSAIFLPNPHVLWLIRPYVFWTISLWLLIIYSINTILYPYALPLIHLPFSLLKSLPKYNLSSELRV